MGATVFNLQKRNTHGSKDVCAEEWELLRSQTAEFAPGVGEGHTSLLCQPSWLTGLSLQPGWMRERKVWKWDLCKAKDPRSWTLDLHLFILQHLFYLQIPEPT